MKDKKKFFRKMDAFEWTMFIVVLVYVLSMIYLLVGFGLLNSFKHWKDFQRKNYFAWPNMAYGKPYPDLEGEYKFLGLQFGNYVQMMSDFYVQIRPVGQAPREVFVWEMFYNSMMYSVLMSLFTIMTQVMVAYAVAKYNFKFKKFIYNLAIIVMLIPIVGSLASEVQMATWLHVKDSILGVCIMRCKYAGMYFLVFYATFKNISWTYAEAAQIDGAGHLQIFLQVMLPLVMNSIFAVFILQFIANFNDYYTPMIFVPEQPTIAYGLYLYQSDAGTNMSTPLKLAASIITCVPILAIFMIFKNKIMGNVSMGGLKG